MTFEIFVGISFSYLLLFPGHGDIQRVSYTAQRQTDPWTAWHDDLVWSLFTRQFVHLLRFDGVKDQLRLITGCRDKRYPQQTCLWE